MRVRALVLLFAGFTVALAAGGRGKLVGTVLDASGAPLPGAKVTFVAETAGVAPVALVTAKDGRVMAGLFPEGRFHVEIPGYNVLRLQYLDKATGAGNYNDAPEVLAAGPKVFAVADGHTTQIQVVVDRTASAPGAAGGPAPKAVPPALARALALYTKGDMPGVLDETAKVLATDPDIGEAQFMRGVALWRTGQPEQAVEPLRTALKLVPDQPGIHGVLGSVLIEAGDRQKAASHASEAQALYVEAAQELGIEAERSGGAPAAINNQVVALERAGRGADAAQALRRLVAAQPDNDKARTRLAELLLDGGQPAQALAELDQVRNPGTETAVAAYNALVALYNQKQHAAVVESARHWIERMPAQGYLHRALGQAYLAEGKVADATREIEEFLRLEPQAPEAAGDREILAALKKR